MLKHPIWSSTFLPATCLLSHFALYRQNTKHQLERPPFEFRVHVQNTILEKKLVCLKEAVEVANSQVISAGPRVTKGRRKPSSLLAFFVLLVGARVKFCQ